jgi:hypothetical protein
MWLMGAHACVTLHMTPDTAFAFHAFTASVSDFAVLFVPVFLNLVSKGRTQVAGEMFQVAVLGPCGVRALHRAGN